MVERGSGGGVSLCGNAVNGNWREGSMLWNLEDKQKMLWRRAFLFIGPSFGEPGRGLVYRGFES
jgi:hypothetical protein